MAIKIQNQALTDHVNVMNEHWIRTEGEYNNDDLAWNAMYHAEHIDNNWWLDALTTILKLWEIDRKPFYGVRGNPMLEVETALKYLHKHWSQSPRCMDKGLKVKHQPGYKALMIIRDVWNNYNGWESPEFKKKPPEDDPTPFERLFDIK